MMRKKNEIARAEGVKDPERSNVNAAKSGRYLAAEATRQPGGFS
jgi:hypothetical protein